ncbi:MAG: hypothetical protein IJS71_02100 [Clostridia bacterium]|nr:hypothetical protein [Clostridia bacterium]
MARSGYATVISLRPDEQEIQFFSGAGRDKSTLRFDSKTYKVKSYWLGDDFMKEFSRCLTEYANANPAYTGKSAYVSILLPNRLVSTTSFNIPGLNKKTTLNLFNVAMESNYSNLADLKYNNLMVKQNKQYATFCVALVRQKLQQDLYAAAGGANLLANLMTYDSAASGCGAVALNSKIANETCIFMDIKESRATITYMTKGLVLGCMDLPFGWSILRQTKPVAENMLFSHDVAELAVINAKEKAKAKALTMMGEMAPGEDEYGFPVEEEGEMMPQDPNFQPKVQAQTVKTLPKKTARVLPKWMQRPIPDTQEGVVYENFRIFQKYALEFIRANLRLTTIAEPTCVYVNMPDEFDFVYELVNAEADENKIKFADLGIKKEKAVIKEHVELYGGLFADQFGSLNNF